VVPEEGSSFLAFLLSFGLPVWKEQTTSADKMAKDSIAHKRARTHARAMKRVAPALSLSLASIPALLCVVP